MVGFDLPHVAHDMILRFMGVNFSAIADGSARIPSSIGDVSKPVWVGLGEDAVAGAEDGTSSAGGTVGAGGKSPEQDKAMWEGAFVLVFESNPSYLRECEKRRSAHCLCMRSLWFNSVLQRRLGRHRTRHLRSHHRRLLLVPHPSSPSRTRARYGR